MTLPQQTPDSETISDLPPLPLRVRSLDGQLIETWSNLWRMRVCSDGGNLITINWERLRTTNEGCAFSARAVHFARLYLADRLRRRKSSTIYNDFATFMYFENWLCKNAGVGRFNWTDLTEALARSFLTHGLEHTAEKGNRFSRLRTFYDWGVARQHPDFNAETLRILKAITAVGNAKGHHVRFRHPVKGPFSPDELVLIRKAIDAGIGNESDRIILMLHLELGHNPNATARLKNKDLIRYETKTATCYQLNVPRVKKRTAHRETKRRPISNKLGTLLERLQTGALEDPLIHWLPPLSPESAVNTALRRFAIVAGLVSPRTTQPLVMNARRFRFSIATHMAEEGASVFHIAEILDHTDTQNVRVYVETVSSIADHVARATDAALTPLVVDRRNGTQQTLSETLLIAFRFFFHSERSTCPLLVEPLVIQQISDFLSPRGRVRSVFERFSIREPDGSYCRMTSHQLRHWLNYIADKGGLPTELQTRWMGREDSRDTNAYRHATADERLEWVKDGIKQGELSGPKADIYYELPSTRRDEFLEGEMRAVHVTALGFCLHDFAVTPCPYHLNCVRGCVDYLRTKGNENERRNLVQIQRVTEQALASAKAHSVSGDTQVAEPWIRHCQETLEGVERALAIDEDHTATTGTKLRPFSNGQSRFKKSEP